MPDMPAVQKSTSTDSKPAKSTAPKARVRWEKAEKRFIAASLLLIALFYASLSWWGRINELPDYQIPNPALPSPNAFDTYQKALWLMAPVVKPAVDPIIDTEEITDPKEIARRYSLPRREAWLKQNAAAFALLRQGLKQQYQQPAARSWSTLFPYFARYRELARRLTIESKTYMMRGRAGAAAFSALDTMRLGSQVPRGGSIIAGLVGIAIESMGRMQLQRVMPHLNAAECRQAARRLETIRAGAWPYVETIREEKWCGQASLLEMMKKPDWAREMTMGMTGSTAENYWMMWNIRFTGKRRIIDNYVNFMDKSIAEALKPYPQTREVPIPDDPVNRILAPTFSRGRFNFARTEAGSGLVLVCLALRSYRLEKGAYPAQISDLVPTYLPQVPADPFSMGKMLRYQKQGDSYKVWSIGPDGKDNNGAPLQQATYPSPRRDKIYQEDLREPNATGDWVMHP